MAEDLSETATETSSRRNMLGLSGKSVGAAAALAAAGIALNMRGARAATPHPGSDLQLRAELRVSRGRILPSVP